MGLSKNDGTLGSLPRRQPLAGVCVLDFGQVYNGPYCGFLLAQAGARVIKVESLVGETLRARGARSSATYAFTMLNGNKECITLNIKSADAQALLKRLVTSVDVVFENFAPGTMDRYGIGAEALRACNHRLIYASSTGFGTVGPYRDYLGMDITLQAMTGVMSITGDAAGPPMKTAAAFADFIAGTHLYGAIVSALYSREQSGEGATVDVSMQDCVFPTLATALGSYYLAGEQKPRAGNRHPGLALAPYNVYETSDGHVALICIREGHWRKVCQAMGDPNLAEDVRFATTQARCENMDALDDLVTEWTRRHTKHEVFGIAQKHGVICAPVQDLEDVVQDPHMAARGTLQQQNHPQLGTIARFQTPLRYKDIEPPEVGGVAELGEDTERVLAELAGVSAAEFARLRESESV